MTELDETTRARWWGAVVARDPAADGDFLYAVRTTGVYCRPTCGARRPRPEHVSFHRTREDAERAGFRACRRCRPDEPPRAAQDAARIAAACRAIDAAEEPVDLAAVARAVGLGRARFQRAFREVTGLTPGAWARAGRAARARALLAAGAPVSAAAFDAGFRSSGRFHEASEAAFGMSAGAYRRGAPGETIRFAVGQTTLGAVLVAATERGVCAVSLGDDPDALVAALAARFRRAEIAPGGAAFDAWVATVVAWVEAPRASLDLPLDVRGTAFERRVWAALRAVPPGTTTTYAALARALGAPTAARAVAAACAANPLALAIPCHRVVRTDGALAGYRWGIDRKAELLRRERPF